MLAPGLMALNLEPETEEYITAKEYLNRREAGEIDPRKVRYASFDPRTGAPGGFYVQLETPRYKVAFPKVKG